MLKNMMIMCLITLLDADDNMLLRVTATKRPDAMHLQMQLSQNGHRCSASLLNGVKYLLGGIILE